MQEPSKHVSQFAELHWYTHTPSSHASQALGLHPGTQPLPIAGTDKLHNDSTQVSKTIIDFFSFLFMT
jgi:hypothetical protein